MDSGHEPNISKDIAIPISIPIDFDSDSGSEFDYKLNMPKISSNTLWFRIDLQHLACLHNDKQDGMPQSLARSKRVVS